MFRHKTPLIFLMAFLMIITICSAVSAQTDEEIRKMAEPMMDNILAAIKTGDYAKYSKDFDENMKEKATEDTFKSLITEMGKYYGTYESREFFKVFSSNDMKKVVWKGKFPKEPAGVSMQLVLKKYDKKWKITGLWFYTWGK